MDKDIVKLFEKYINKQCSTGELDKVLSFIKAGKYFEEWDHVLTQGSRIFLENETDIPLRSEITKLETHHRLLNSVNEHQKNQKTSTYKLSWKVISITAAASVLIIFGWLSAVNKGNLNPNENGRITYQSDVAPGKFGAKLRLTNGKVISLDETKSGLIVNDQLLSYNDGTELAAAGNASVENTYTAWTDNGNMYTFTLPDGTLVSLNAGSQLNFPAKFAGKSRQVSLKGEAFFKVAKNKSLPFVVESNGQQVEVLGTEFNINSYPDELATKTTLVEGSVRISSINNTFTLRPGQQALLNTKGALSVAEADTTLVTAWKNNKFIFENNDIQSVMRMIKRWYNVEVIYAGSLPDVTFGGKVSRFQNVSGVLRVLERTGGVHFKIEDKKIYVYK